MRIDETIFFNNKIDIKPPKRFIFTQPGMYSVFSFNFGLLIIKLKIRGFPVVMYEYTKFWFHADTVVRFR
jgi:hypothetical protein